MGTEQSTPAGPDLALGIPTGDLPDGHVLAGHVGDDAVLVARRGSEFFAIGATCSHYGGALAEGLMVDDTVRCPWHHACFSLRTGEALHPPALSPVACWAVERRDGKLFVTTKTEAQAPKKRSRATAAAGVPERIVIIGGGAAGFAAAEKY
jgi:nitrite reductase/ring-hydroxylating ferredoxin subunit